MKTIKASLLSLLLTIFISLGLSGCYTQLALVDNEQDSAFEPLTTIINQPNIVTVYVPVSVLVYDPPSCDVFHSMPNAGSTSTVSESQPQPQTRNSGYQRADQSENTQTTNPISDRRASGSMRGGR
jgi:hypothetical protein